MRNTRSRRLCIVRNLLAILLVVLGGPALGQERTPEGDWLVEQPTPSVVRAAFAGFEPSKRAELTETAAAGPLADADAPGPDEHGKNDVQLMFGPSDLHGLDRAVQAEPIREEPSSVPASSSGPRTRIGLYVFMAAIGGDVGFRGVEADVDVSFSDILDNLDSGFMGFAEHRRGPWSFLADAVYLDVSKSGNGTRVVGPLGMGQATVSAEIEFQQTLIESFVGYRALEHDLGHGRLGVDALAGARYNRLEVELSSEVGLFGLTSSGDRDGDEDWVDGVFGLRAEYLADAGWSLSGWADYGVGEDSYSYQLAAFVNYRFANGVTLSGGYRYYYMNYETGSGSSRLEFDLDYSGPMIGLTYSF